TCCRSRTRAPTTSTFAVVATLAYRSTRRGSRPRCRSFSSVSSRSRGNSWSIRSPAATPLALPPSNWIGAGSASRSTGTTSRVHAGAPPTPCLRPTAPAPQQGKVAAEALFEVFVDRGQVGDVVRRHRPAVAQVGFAGTEEAGQVGKLSAKTVNARVERLAMQ